MKAIWDEYKRTYLLRPETEQERIDLPYRGYSVTNYTRDLYDRD